MASTRPHRPVGHGARQGDRLVERLRHAAKSETDPPESYISYLRNRAARWVYHTSAGFVFDSVQTIMSLVACVMYVVATYLEEQSWRPWWIIAFEWLVFVLFTFDYLLRMFIAESVTAYITSREAIIDLLSILPIITVNSSVTIGFFRVLRVFRIVRILRSFRTLGTVNVEASDTAVSQQVAVLGFILFSYTFIGAGLVHSAERLRRGTFQWPGSSECDWDHLEGLRVGQLPADCQLDFFQALYFVLITVTTVGYGDIAPADNVGRLITLMVLLPLFFIVPREISKLTDLMERRPRFAKPMQSTGTPHVIVCGDIDHKVAMAFLSEFFHSDHGHQRMTVVFFSPWEPTGALEALVTNPVLGDKVQYVRGSPFASHELHRAHILSAHAVFVIATQANVDVVGRDMKAVLMVKAIKSVSPWVPVFCQLVDPANKIHGAWCGWDHFISVQELRMGIMAKNAIYPGFSTFISNLIMSSSNFDTSALPEWEREWTNEYIHGYQQELYTIELAPCFTGMLFSVAVNRVYHMFGLCLFAIETEKVRGKRTRTGALLNLEHSTNDPDDDDEDDDDEEGWAENDPELVRRAQHERTRQLEAMYQAKLGVVSTSDLLEETDIDRWQREREERKNSAILINPKNYIIRQGDKAIMIGSNHTQALSVQQWDGNVPHDVAYVCSITPADKATFERLNNGRGPLLRSAEPQLMAAVAVAAASAPNSILGPEEAEEEDEADSDGGRRERRGRSADSALSFFAPNGLPAAPAPAAAMTRDAARRPAATPRSPPASPSPGRRGGGTPTGGASSLGARAVPTEGWSDDIPHPNPGEFGPVMTACNLQGHVVVCGEVDDGLMYLLERLRVETATPIVVLHPHPLPPTLPLRPSAAHDIFFVQGSTLHVPDLERAGLPTASVALITARAEEDPEAGFLLEDATSSDLEAVFTTCVCESSFPHCRLVVEMLDPDNMRFMNYAPTRDSIPRALWPQYACGRVFTAWALDTLLCQAFYNPTLIPVITRFVKGKPDERDGADDREASGDERRSSHTVLRGPGSVVVRVEEHSHFIQMQVPLPYINRHYKDLFSELMLTRGILPLGLFRTNHMKQSLLPYVIANPTPLTVLHPEDRLLVLCSDDLLTRATQTPLEMLRRQEED